LDIDIPEDRDYDTIAGMVIDLLGRIPDENEHPEIAFSRVTFTVLEMEDKRISKIKITSNPMTEMSSRDVSEDKR
jgi:putative hemolysin